MWYGSNLNLWRSHKNNKFRQNLRDRKLGRPLPRRNSLAVTQSKFQIPHNWQTMILQQPQVKGSTFNIYAFNGTYFFNIAAIRDLKDIKFDKQTRILSFSHLSSSYCYFSYLAQLRDLFSRFMVPFFKKIRFKGKGYYMYKNVRNTIAPQFGYAHRVYVYAPATAVRFLSKTKILLFGLSRKDVLTTSHSLKRVKPINIFTGRGVRFARQIVYKKTGKVSSYR